MNTAWSEEEIYLIASLARDLALQGQYEDAAVIFDGLTAVAPANTYVRNALAALCTQLERPETTLAVLAAGPDSPRGGQLRVEALLDLGRHQEAGAELRRIGATLAPPTVERLAMRVMRQTV